jgi:hypothetical protein
MKLTLVILGLVLALNVLAFPHDVECTGTFNGQKIAAYVEQNFGGDQFSYRDASVVVDGTTSEYEVRASRWGSYGLAFDGKGYSLTVDFWPDNSPRWGSFYTGTLVTAALENQKVRNLRCRFPNL